MRSIRSLLSTLVLAALAAFSTPSFAGEAVQAAASVIPSLSARSAVGEITPAPHYTMSFEVRNAAGRVKWTEGPIHNTVVTQGGNYLIDCGFKGTGCLSTWYLIPKAAGTIAAGDTYASHAGWTEATAYAAATRPAITFGTTSARSNTATAVSYSINGTVTIAGACTLGGSSTKSDTAAAGGVLYSCTDFAGARSVVSGDTLTVTLTVSD